MERSETVERPIPRATSGQARLVLAAITIMFVTLVLVPPFTPPAPWRWVTDRVPWQVVDRVPWSPYPTTATQVKADDGNGLCAYSAHVVAFGHMWTARGEMRGFPGGFRQLDRTHAVFEGLSYTLSPNIFDDLACPVSRP